MPTSSKPSVLRGVQRPRYAHVPSAPSSAGQETIQLAASAGLILEPAQCLVLEGALGERRDGRWAATQVGFLEPRQNGKGGTLEARQLAGLFLFRERLATHTAHRVDTCLEHFRRLVVRIEDTPDLSRQVKTIYKGNGAESIELWTPKHGTQRLNFKARSKGSGRGFDGSVIYLDEAFWLLELGSLVPTMSAQWNPQLWYTSSAPLPRAESDILRSVVKKGRGAARRQKAALLQARRLAYFEWCGEISADPADRSKWEAAIDDLLANDVAHDKALQEANPGLGYRLTRDSADLDRSAMTTEEYARERLGIYPEVIEVHDPAIDAADWRACESPVMPDGVTSTSKPVAPVTFAFEVSTNRKWSQIAVAAPSTLVGDSGGITHVELVANRPGTDWVVPRLVELRNNHKPAAIVCLPSGPAGSLLESAKAAGLVIGLPNGHDAKHRPKYRPVTGADFAQACGAAYDEITEHRWRHVPAPELNAAVTGATKRAVGDAWVFDRRAGVDISPLSAVTLAAWASGRAEGAKPTPEVHTWADDDEEFNEILRELEAEDDEGDPVDRA